MREREAIVARAIEVYRRHVSRWLVALADGDVVPERSISEADAELDVAISKAFRAG